MTLNLWKLATVVAAFVCAPFTLLALLFLASTAQAQSGLPSTDPSKLGADVGALAATVLFIVQFIKRQFERQGRPLLWGQTLAVTLALGLSISALLFYAGYGARFGSTAPPLTWILFGLVASGIASGLKDLLSSLAERGRSEVIVQAPATASALPPSQPGQTVVTPTGFQPLADLGTPARATPALQVQDGADGAQGFPSATRLDWPEVPGLDDPLIHQGDGVYRPQ